MIFNFNNSAIFTANIKAPLSVKFGNTLNVNTYDTTTFNINGVNATDPVFTMVAPQPISTELTVVNPNPPTAELHYFWFNKPESIQVTLDNPLANNADVIDYPIYDLRPQDCNRVVLGEYVWDFTNPRNSNLLDLFKLDNPCKDEVPNDPFFHFTDTCYGEMCSIVESVVAGDLFSSLDDMQGSVSGEIDPVARADIADTLDEMTGFVQGQTSVLHAASITDTLETMTGSMDAYTPERYDADITSTLADATGSFDAHTTELHDGAITATLDNVVGVIAARTSETHTGDVVATLEPMTGIVSAETTESNRAVIVATLDDITPEVYGTFDVPTEVQNIAHKVNGTLEQADEVTLGYCSTVKPAVGLYSVTQSSMVEAVPMKVTQCQDIRTKVQVTRKYSSKLENASHLGLTVHSAILTTIAISGSTCVSLEDAEQLSHGVCHVAFSQERLLSYDVCGVLEDMYSGSVGVKPVPVAIGEVLSADPVFDMSQHVHGAHFPIDNPVTYINAVTYYSNIVTIGLCSGTAKTEHLYNHTCAVLEHTCELESGVYIPTEPPTVPPTTEPPETGTTTVIPPQETYDMENSIIAVTSDGTAIELTSVNLTFDADSLSWLASGSLADPEQRSIVKPDANGVPKPLAITINGFTWTILIERLQRQRVFAKSTVSFSGRGIAALLSDKYYPTTSYTQSVIQTNQQIAEAIVPFGWTITWNMPVWTLPANTYSHSEKSPLSALSALVTDCGGMIVPDPIAQEIVVKPRYPVLPWHFDQVAVDYVIPDSVITEITEEPITTYGIDGVYIHGTSNNAVQAFARLTGTAGSKLGTTVGNQMVVDATAVRSIGERSLAAQYTQPVIKTITTPMDGVIVPFITVGSFIEVDLSTEENVRGIVNGVSISVTLQNDAPVVSQSLTIGETTNNNVSLLKEVVGQSAVVLGVVKSTSVGTSRVELLNGGIQDVAGVGVVGAPYFIKDSAIVSEAPTAVAIAEVVI